MDKIIELATGLGEAISDSQQATQLKAARENLNKEKQASQLLKDYQAQSDRIAQLEREQKPVEVDDKQKLQELHERLIASEAFKRFTAAQVEYVDLMRKVNEAIRKHLGETEGT